MMKYYTSIMEEDGESYLILNPLLLKSLKWDENTKLSWVIETDGRVYLKKDVIND